MALKTRLIRLLSAPRLREIDRFMGASGSGAAETAPPAAGPGRSDAFRHGARLSRDPDRGAIRLAGTGNRLRRFHAVHRADAPGRSGRLLARRGPLVRQIVGTTSAKSKFIPVSREGLRGCHMRGPARHRLPDQLAMARHGRILGQNADARRQPASRNDRRPRSGRRPGRPFWIENTAPAAGPGCAFRSPRRR